MKDDTAHKKDARIDGADSEMQATQDTRSQGVAAPGRAPQDTAPPDTLNEQIGVLTRREVEARIIGPILHALGEAFDHDEVRAIVQDEIVRIAREQGGALAETMGEDSLSCFADSLQFWTRDNALEIEVLTSTDEAFAFNVTRCQYAELYRQLGIPELGALLSCNRDFALIEGFNDQVQLTRSQTIMEGAPHCDFRYQLPESPDDGNQG